MPVYVKAINVPFISTITRTSWVNMKIYMENKLFDKEKACTTDNL